jgi:AraC-like DNA-binding protein
MSGPNTQYDPVEVSALQPEQVAAARDDALAAIAAEAGYADQAHLTRECGRLSGLTPAALARHRAA